MLIDFWTYTCINCLRTLPQVEAWYEKYRRDGLVVLGVHTPEFPFERISSNVEEAIGANGLSYPVVQDNEYGTWNAFANQYWPAKYLIDADGARPLRAFRRGRLRGDRAGDPLAARRARVAAPRGRDAGARRGGLEDRC